MNQNGGSFSGGGRVPLNLARALMCPAEVLLLDEPTVGLDPIATTEFYQTVDQLKSQGTSVILCSHVLPGVEQHIDRAMIISSGKKLAEGSLAELRKLAHLPTKITVQGLADSIKQDPILTTYFDQQPSNILRVPEQEKMQILRHLLTYSSIQDVNVEPANLEQVYQYFLQQTPEKNQSVNAAGATS